MKQAYNITWLTDKFDAGETIKFLYFWGHTNKLNEEVGKFCFSQWFELPFVVENVIYPTTEHWMMANKALLFEDFKIYSKIITSKSPGEAKELGRSVMGFDEHLWNNNKVNIVKTGNIHKFNQNRIFGEYLINTKDRVLVEASPLDKIWGIGLDQNDDHADNPYCWNGQNLLGFILMEVRDFLKKYGYFDYMQSEIVPPWKMYPNISPFDLFWKMGIGEEHISKFLKYLSTLSEREHLIFQLSNPAPYQWGNFYA